MRTSSSRRRNSSRPDRTQPPICSFVTTGHERNVARAIARLTCDADEARILLADLALEVQERIAEPAIWDAIVRLADMLELCGGELNQAQVIRLLGPTPLSPRELTERQRISDMIASASDLPLPPRRPYRHRARSRPRIKGFWLSGQ
jgi:hypothetical protein